MIEKEKYDKTIKILIKYRTETTVRERYKTTNEKNLIRLKNRKHTKHLKSGSWTNDKKRNKLLMKAESITVGGRIYLQKVLLEDIV